MRTGLPRGQATVPDQGDRGIDHLVQVMRRNLRAHSDCDSRAALHQQERDAGGKHEGLALPDKEMHSQQGSAKARRGT